MEKAYSSSMPGICKSAIWLSSGYSLAWDAHRIRGMCALKQLVNMQNGVAGILMPFTPADKYRLGQPFIGSGRCVEIRSYAKIGRVIFSGSVFIPNQIHV